MELVFDKPAAIGELRWATGWRDESDLFGRVFATVMATLCGGGAIAYGLSWLFGDPRPSLPYAIPFVLVAIGAFIFFGPDRHCICAGDKGASISHRRFGFVTSRDVLRYEEADDVELESTRIVSDAVGQIYMHTRLTFSFLDREGYEVFAIEGLIDEPEQRAETKYDPTAPLQLDGGRNRDAEFGFAAMEAFHAFKDQRSIGPYR